MAIATTQEELNETSEHNIAEIDSKYRLIIVAAKRSKQLQRGARPRIDIDPPSINPHESRLKKLSGARLVFGRRTVTREQTTKKADTHHVENLHSFVIRSAAAFRRNPVDNLVGIHYVAGLAVHAV